MRNARPWAVNAMPGMHSTAPNTTAASTTDGATPRPTDGPADQTRPGASIDAQILQQLRTRLRTTGSLESVAGEIRRLGTLAAAAHRGCVAGLPAGTPLAMSLPTAADVRGLDQSEDAA